MNLEKLKETARKYEQKEEWRKAIDVYLKAIHQVEEGAESSPDLSLYNRVGDLHLKVNDISAAVRSYERAVDLYADQGFFNNAIALCGKILRVNPARTQTYLKLAQLHARKNVVIEAKRNLIEFLERMNALGQIEQAFESVKTFADQFSGSAEIRMMLVELLRAASREDEAREQLEKLAGELEAVGDITGARRTRERLQVIDHSGEPDEPGEPGEAPRRPAESAPARGGLIFLDTGLESESPTAVSAAPGLEPTAASMLDEPRAEPLPGLETTGADGESIDAQAGGLDMELESLVIERVEPVAMDFDGARIDGMEGTPLDLPDAFDLAVSEAEVVSGVELDVVDLDPELEIAAPMELEAADAEPLALELAADEPLALDGGAGLSFLDTGAEAAADTALLGDGELFSLEDQVLDDPDNPDLHRDLADALFMADQPERALDELGLALAGYEARENWAAASGIVERFLAVYPDSIRLYQKQVELAYRTGDRGTLIAAYLGLGDALARTGSTEKAVAVFRRVREHDPGNVRAATALAVLLPEPEPELEPAVMPVPVQPEPIAADDSAEPHESVEPGHGYEAQAHEARDTSEPERRAAVPPAVRPPVFSGSSSAPAPTVPETPLVARPAAAPPVQSIPAQSSASSPSAPAAPAPAPAASVPSARSMPPRAAPPSDDFVDLGALVLDPQAPADTRMRVDRAEPLGDDEQREFQEILEQFKRGIEDNLAAEDYDAHYDLGVAFKEMGLLDEAVAEFQKAARAPSVAARLRATEALGVAFCEKGQYAVAETVLRRALSALDAPDESKIGLIYWLGRAEEAQGNGMEAIANYERALAVDIRFMDLNERVNRLTAKGEGGR